MHYATVCSGIECFSAGVPSSWSPVFFSEIEAFPKKVLKHHYPGVPNYGDMRNYESWPDHAIDLLAGGTPCQSFSVAGLREGLRDPRGNLMLTYLAVAQRYKPRWVIWENVPGVLSSNGGRDFGTLLRGLAECGYGFAYRILDAQFVRVDSHRRAVPQRRRRVFVVGHTDWRRAAAVLLERSSLSWDPAPRREAGTDPASGAISRALSRVGGGDDPGANKGAALIAGPLGAGRGGGGRTTDLDNHGAYVAGPLGWTGTGSWNNTLDGNGAFIPEIVGQAMSSKWSKGSSGPAGDEHQNLVAFAQNTRSEVRLQGGNGMLAGPLSAEHGMNQTTYVAFDTTQITHPENRNNPQPGDPCHPLAAGAHPPAVAFKPSHYTRGKDGAPDEVMPPLSADADKGDQDPLLMVADPISANEGSTYTHEGKNFRLHNVLPTVRRLTPTECERLMGLPDGYTDFGKADGPRYKALGNGMAVNVIRWLCQRIDMVEGIDG